MDGLRQAAPRAALIVALLVAVIFAAEPVKLTPYPQKVRTFYAPDDPAVPAALREPAGSSGA